MNYNLEKSIEVLEHTPFVLDNLLSGLSEEWVYRNEGGETWSAFDVVGHLIEGELNDWIQRMNIILQQHGNRTFKPFDRFAQLEANKGKEIQELLDLFKKLRKANVDKLKQIKLKAEDYHLTGMHPALGEVTLKNLLATWVVHDLNHISQIVRAMAYQYKTEVGPWSEYLPILNRLH